MPQPFVSVILPTKNAERDLEACLTSLRKQTYPRDRYELLVIDGGSTDRTLEIAKRHAVTLLHEEQSHAEYGKTLGVAHAKGDMLAFVDADNEIVQADWLERLVHALTQEPDLLGVESEYVADPRDTSLNHYLTALLYLSDPLAYHLAPRPLRLHQRDGYVVYEYNPQRPFYPTGGNGFLCRAALVKRYLQGRFEESTLFARAMADGHGKIARVPGVGLYHHYANSIGEFLAKRKKVIRNYWLRRSTLSTTWVERASRGRMAGVILYEATIIGPLAESLWHLLNTGRIAWGWHPVMCWLTVISSAYYTLQLKWSARRP